MDLRCPKCNSTDLNKVSLAYEEGLFRSDARTQMRGILVGTGGPGILMGSAATKGTHQTALSKRFSPPKKWSYLKPLVGLGVLSFVALIVYVHAVMSSGSTASSLPVKIYAAVASLLFVSVELLTWQHNSAIYQRKYAEWDGSFICLHCGAISQQKARNS